MGHVHSISKSVCVYHMIISRIPSQLSSDLSLLHCLEEFQSKIHQDRKSNHLHFGWMPQILQRSWLGCQQKNVLFNRPVVSKIRSSHVASKGTRDPAQTSLSCQTPEMHCIFQEIPCPILTTSTLVVESIGTKEGFGTFN